MLGHLAGGSLVMKVSVLPHAIHRHAAIPSAPRRHDANRSRCDAWNSYDYRRHWETYFGQIDRNGRGVNSDFEMFEWLVATYLNFPRESVAKHFEGSLQYSKMSHEDMVLAFCEGMVASLRHQRATA
jgi:hypothetical protein